MNDLLALPNEWIERLFLRFQAIYGNRLTTMFGDAEPDEVKGTWAQKLAGFDGVDIGYAIDACEYVSPDFPPTLFKFTELCRIGRSKRIGEMTKLEPPDQRGVLHPEVAAKVDELLTTMRKRKRDNKAWAKRLLERHRNGEHVAPIALESARMALRIDDVEGEAERVAIQGQA